MTRYSLIHNRHAIFDHETVMAETGRAIAKAAPDDRRMALVSVLRDALRNGQAEIRRRLIASPRRGLEHASATAFLTDQILLLAHNATIRHLYRLENPTIAERIALVAVGGYGRALMAPHSDIDLMFLIPKRNTAWVEQVAEAILYTLWDLNLKVGFSTRTVDDVLRYSQEDLSTQTSILEARFLCGEEALFDEMRGRFEAEIQKKNARTFMEDKIAERDNRHIRMGDTRFVVEPNLKEGKGGLRDLQTLYWIAKFTMQVHDTRELVTAGLFSASEYYQFQRALSYLWSVRVQLHDLTGRAEERLTFDVQPALAKRLQYKDRPGTTAVELFMRHYFLTIQRVGSLTGLFLAHFEEEARRMNWISALVPSYRLNGFRITGSRIEAPDADFFREDPVRLVGLFAMAGRHELSIHPMTLRQATRDTGLITHEVRNDPEANRLFLEILCDSADREHLLRTMNECGVFGRFLPDFGRIVAKMQFDMYHHYTVDEHTIRAIGLLSAIEAGQCADTYRQAAAIMRQVSSRRVLYVAVLLHDIAKGRPGNHSVVGARIAMKIGPRLGLSEAETEDVAWLVRWHLLMSGMAFKRDLSSPSTIREFCRHVTSMERLRMLFLLTIVDISAVGPDVFNAWKGQLLRTLFESAEEVLRLGHKQKNRQRHVQSQQAALAKLAGGNPDTLQAHFARLADSYWLAETPDVLAANLRLVTETDRDGASTGIATITDADLKTTLVSVYSRDSVGLFSRIAGGIALAGATIIGARIHTTSDGMALDNFVVQDPLGGTIDDERQTERLRAALTEAIAGRLDLQDELGKRPLPRLRQENFRVTPQVLIDNRTSRRFTIVEVVALDRPALLFQLAHAFYRFGATVHSAHIATYGERAIDTFYVTDRHGHRLDSEAQDILEKRLLKAAGLPEKKRKPSKKKGQSRTTVAV